MPENDPKKNKSTAIPDKDLEAKFNSAMAEFNEMKRQFELDKKEFSAYVK